MLCSVFARLALSVAENAYFQLLGALNTLLEWIVLNFDVVVDPLYEDALLVCFIQKKNFHLI